MPDHGVAKHYRIAFVDETDLPPDQDFVFMECQGDMWLAVKATRVTPKVLEDAWETYRETDWSEK